MTKSAETRSPSALSRLPSIQEIDRHLAAAGLPHGKPVRGRVAAVLAAYRERLRAGPLALEALPGREAVLRAVEEAIRRPEPGRLRRVINATGVVVHTNLGRAVLAPGVTAEALPLLHAYTNLELDLETGQRGPRGGKVPELLARLSGAERGLAVNNNAAAVLLLLSALAAGGEVIVSRGELVEIGGAFRIPEIMAQSGARLVEVGTTNRTRLSDYAGAITPETRALLKVHRSNFAMTGFVEEVAVPELAELARERKLALWHDLGSGNFYRFTQPALSQVPTVAQHLREGADVLTFSGDKLLGAVQAGLAVGREAPLAQMARHPLYRGLRMDKVRLALLERSLEDYLEPARLRARNPTIDFLERTIAELEPMAAEVMRALGAPKGRAPRWELVRGHSLAGGGALPEVSIETLCLALERPGEDVQALAAGLRAHDPPILCRVQEGRALIDFRTLFPQDLSEIVSAVGALLSH
jgi:L-seryl-tRNA(Ser) seleniumtransferase